MDEILPNAKIRATLRNYNQAVYLYFSIGMRQYLNLNDAEGKQPAIELELKEDTQGRYMVVRPITQKQVIRNEVRNKLGSGNSRRSRQ